MSNVPNPVVRRAAILIANSAGSPEQIAEQLDAAGMLQRPTECVQAAFPIYLHRRGVGIQLDVHALVGALVATLASKLVEDPDGVGSQLAEIDATSGAERDELLDALLIDLGGATQSLSSSKARELADRLYAAAGPALPHQREAS